MVIRSFPIRVSRDSGPLKNEITWDILREGLSRTDDMTEYTSCTNHIRRVGRFDAEVVKRSIISNTPNIIVLNHLDYVNNNYKTAGMKSEKINDFLRLVESKIGRNINFVGIDGISLIEKEGE